MEITRELAIKVLNRMINTGIAYDDGYGIQELTEDEKNACLMGLSSLKTDEAFQLEYESRDAVEVIRCKDCKYFNYDYVVNVDGIPLIMGHEVCNKWGEGCKSNENGYCFLAEKRVNEDGDNVK